MFLIYSALSILLISLLWFIYISSGLSSVVFSWEICNDRQCDVDVTDYGMCVQDADSGRKLKTTCLNTTGFEFSSHWPAQLYRHFSQFIILIIVSRNIVAKLWDMTCAWTLHMGVARAGESALRAWCQLNMQTSYNSRRGVCQLKLSFVIWTDNSQRTGGVKFPLWIHSVEWFSGLITRNKKFWGEYEATVLLYTWIWK